MGGPGQRGVWARRALLALLVAYCAAVAVALLAPTSSEQSHLVLELRRSAQHLGVRMRDFTQPRAEFLCNALILVPVSALGSLVWRSTTWRDWTAYAFVLAGLVELAQALLLPERTAAFADVCANTLGGLGGALVVLYGRRLLGR